MEIHARAPDPLSLSDDMAATWNTWKEDFNIFMKVTGYINKPNEMKVNLLMNRIGPVGLNVIKNLSFNRPSDKENMDIMLSKLDAYFDPPKREVEERNKFFSIAMKSNESITTYIHNLKEKAKTCNFGDLADSLVRDMVIFHTHDKILRKKYLAEENLDMDKIIAMHKEHKIVSDTQKLSIEKNNKVEKCFKCGVLKHFPHSCQNITSKNTNENIIKNTQKRKNKPTTQKILNIPAQSTSHFNKNV